MSSRPPDWAIDFVDAVSSCQTDIDSALAGGRSSDQILGRLRAPLELLGYTVETGKRASDKVRRPVLFGDEGAVKVAFEVDAVHEDLAILVEIEAGRGAMSNAIYRDLIRTSLMVDARFLVLGVMKEYRYKGGTNRTYQDAHGLLAAIYASGRIQLPFEGVLLFGY